MYTYVFNISRYKSFRDFFYHLFIFSTFSFPYIFLTIPAASLLTDVVILVKKYLRIVCVYFPNAKKNCTRFRTFLWFILDWLKCFRAGNQVDLTAKKATKPNVEYTGTYVCMLILCAVLSCLEMRYNNSKSSNILLDVL